MRLLFFSGGETDAIRLLMYLHAHAAQGVGQPRLILRGAVIQTHIPPKAESAARQRR